MLINVYQFPGEQGQLPDEFPGRGPHFNRWPKRHFFFFKIHYGQPGTGFQDTPHLLIKACNLGSRKDVKHG